LSISASMKLFGHRGASYTCPENTAAAFTNALTGSGGAHPAVTGVECDMQLLRDGTVVVLHDDTLRRTAQHECNTAHEGIMDVDVTELSWDQLRDVDVGAWKGDEWAGERILPVADFFALIASHPGAATLVELKGGDQAMVEPAVAAATAALAGGLAAESVWWISFDLALVAAMKRALPQTSAWHVVHVRPEDGEARCLELLAAAKAAGVDGVDFAALPEVVTPAVFEAAQQAGLGVGVWVSSGLAKNREVPLDTAANCELFAERGAVFFTSDLPEEVWGWWDRTVQQQQEEQPPPLLAATPAAALADAGSSGGASQL
jgi:glycerophosphoryl diester phosphodiesterase